MEFRIGERVRVNAGHFYGATGTITARRGNAWTVRMDSGWGYRDFFPRDLISAYANNGD